MNKEKRSLFWSIAALSVALSLGPGTAVAADPPGEGNVSLGKSIYESKCVECHGKEGKGNGPASATLQPRPRDFTAGKFKFRSTETGSIPTDEDLLNSVRNGLHGTAMPDWTPYLRGDSLKAVIAYVKSFSPRFQNETPKGVKLGTPVPSTPASVAAGKKVYEKLECASCHGRDGMGKDAITRDFQDDWGHDVRATNLTEPWAFRGGRTPKDIYLRFRTGIDGSPMPSYVGSASERDMWDLANFVASFGRKPLWEMNELEIKAFEAAQSAAAKENPVERGKYLVTTLGCGHCHSSVREDGSMIEELRLAGGQHWNLYPFDDLVSYNLTSDKETGLGNWTDAQIKTLLTTGVRRNGSRMIPYPMPWPAFTSMREEDLNAIVAYLRSLPPVYNKIPDPKSPNIFSYLWGKFQVLILKKNIPIHVYPGNAGTTRDKVVAANDRPSHQESKGGQP